jgi:hypothetical protein
MTPVAATPIGEIWFLTGLTKGCIAAKTGTTMSVNDIIASLWAVQSVRVAEGPSWQCSCKRGYS